MNSLSITTPWKSWRKSLLQTADAPADWLDEDEIHDIIAEANREGVSARTVITCRKAEEGLAAAATPHLPIAPHRPRILVVEPDQEYAQRLLQVLSASDRYAVEVVADGRSALQWCRQQQPDLLITEMELTNGINGTGLAHYVREITHRRIPVIVLENVLAGSDVSIVSSKNALHLSKPVKLKSLLHCVVHLLRVVV